ncbi:haloacid dehalogenase type II [Mesorhizobium koreense]|uniref:haloacid dehalogenase type II n=1 Tax=Mesorhizobium koreense TaxID=3074855 RepID=UPI00287B8243|nr:haloacid dehalogenase type II [Mesorhizobium sp. WR6]
MNATKLSGVKALTFDVFGTIADWRTSISSEVTKCARKYGVDIDGVEFADAWRAQYRPSMDKVRDKVLPWRNIDELHLIVLRNLIEQFGLREISETDLHGLNHAWHRLNPWPDVLPGMTRLRQRYTLASLSNGNMALLINMAKLHGIPWDCIFSAELFKCYKPDQQLYKGAVEFLGLSPEEVMMVASHKFDVEAAALIGMRTAFVPRPAESSPQWNVDLNPSATFDVVADSFEQLADVMGA